MFMEQTCFQGKFGEEVGSDQFGAAIMIHQPALDARVVAARMSHVEITYAGQAFRLGRYPVHFHLNGDLAGSYVRGCAIHRSFNRAVNIHNTHNVLVEDTVIYDVMGGAFFLEDSIETGNVLQYNLALFVRSSSSLLNDDVTPAAFWVTHPDNIVRHNHVAGGTHFGFWYRMMSRPQGPSFTRDICPQQIPLRRGQFTNNTVHSVGWYGLWVFEQYHPMDGGTCLKNKTATAVFEKLVTWNAMRGAEWGVCPTCQFHDMVLANNFFAGIEMLFLAPKLNLSHPLAPYYTDEGPLLKNNVIIASLNHDNHPPATIKGLVLPFDEGLLVDGITFVNFNETNSAAIGLVKVVCVCGKICGGWMYKFKRVKWYNSPMKAAIEWEFQFELDDVDGSLSGTGKPSSRVLPSSALLPRDQCADDPAGTGFSAWSYNGTVCQPGVDVVRFSFNGMHPDSLMFKDMFVSNRHGTTRFPWRRKREKHDNGWMGHLTVGHVHQTYFENAKQIANFSYNGKVWGLEVICACVLKYDVIYYCNNICNNIDKFRH